MTLARVSVFGLALATVSGLCACPLENAAFGRNCETSNECGVGYACVDSTCLPRDLLEDPAAPDGGGERSDAGGVADAGAADGGPSIVDAGVDAGTPVVDAGVDAGTPVVDAGGDGGPTRIDAGPNDAGPFDAGGEVDGGGPAGTELVVGEPGPNDPIILRPSSLNDSDAFGAALAMNDETLAIGVPGADMVVLVDITVHPPVIEQVITPPTFASTTHRFGASVALAGELLLVGAPAASGGVSAQGALLVYLDDAGSYSLLDQEFSPGPTPNGNFGTAVGAVALDGFNVNFVVGEPGAQNGTAERPGAAHTYLYLDGSGVLEYQSTGYSPVADPAITGQGFGESVAISETNVVIAAPRENVAGASGSRRGHVYVYTPTTPGVGHFEAPPIVIEGPDIQSPGTFGSALSIGSTRLHVGLTELGLSPNVHGVVISYNLNTFAQVPSVIEPLIPAPRFFGQTVIEDELGITVGAARPEFNFLDRSNGAIFRFTLDNSPVEASGPNPDVDLGEDDRYGAALATNNTFIAAGAPGYHDGESTDADNTTGAVVLFRR